MPMKPLGEGVHPWAEDLRCDKVIAQCLDRGIIGLPSLVHCQGGLTTRSPDSD